MADGGRRASQIDWNRPPGQTSTKCPECLGQCSVMVERFYSASDGIGTMRVTAQCRGCDGRGKFPGMQPPA